MTETLHGCPTCGRLVLTRKRPQRGAKPDVIVLSEGNNQDCRMTMIDYDPAEYHSSGRLVPAGRAALQEETR